MVLVGVYMRAEGGRKVIAAMRKDMPKLLCERPRYGGDPTAKKSLRRRFNDKNNFEDAPKRTGNGRGRIYGWNCKQLNEYLQPLARFLESRVGQHWDDVYSEIRENLGATSTIHMHVMQHLWGYVERNVRVADCGTLVVLKEYGGGGPYFVNGKGGWNAVQKDWRYSSTDLFVHPVTGILCTTYKAGQTWGRPQAKKPVDKTKHRFAHRHFVKHNGFWFELDVIPLPDGVKWGEQVEANQSHVEARWYTPRYGKQRPRLLEAGHVDVTYGVEDHFFGHTGGREVWGALVKPELRKVKSWYGSLKVYCPGVLKKQLNSKELRKVGLKNDGGVN